MAKKTNSKVQYNLKDGSQKEYTYCKIKRKIAPGVYKTFNGVSKADAEAKYKRYIESLQYQNGAMINKSFDSLMRLYIQDVFIQDSKYKDSTKQRYVNAYNNTLALDPLALQPIKDIRILDLQNAYNHMNCASSTIGQVNKLLTLFYTWLEKNDITRNISGALIIPGEKRKKNNQIIETWSKKELYLIISNLNRKNYTIAAAPKLKYKRFYYGPADHRSIERLKNKYRHFRSRSAHHFDKSRIKCLIYLLALTGCRISEALALTWDDITPDGIRINKQLGTVSTFQNGKRISTSINDKSIVKSSSSDRLVPINNQLKKELKNHRKWQNQDAIKRGYRTDLLFTTKTGQPYERATLRKTFNRYYKRIGIPCRGFHCYRHTYGSQLAAAGVPIQVVSKLLGHDSIETTNKYYIHIDQEQKKNAVLKLSV